MTQRVVLPEVPLSQSQNDGIDNLARPAATCMNAVNSSMQPVESPNQSMPRAMSLGKKCFLKQTMLFILTVMCGDIRTARF